MAATAASQKEGDYALISKPSRKASIAESLCDYLESFLDLWIRDPPGKIFLSGNFGPVEETGPRNNLEVKGTLPACLNGDFARNGPNPKFAPRAGYHWFDGDGMVHVVRIRDGSASYTCRLVRTSKLRQEEERQRTQFLKMGDMAGVVGLAKLLLQQLRIYLGAIDVRYGSGTANTALAVHNGRLMALQEADAPYLLTLLQDGEMETVGRETYGGQLTHPFTAHPKSDPETGELFFFGYDLARTPYLTYRFVTRDGRLMPPVPITLPRPVMMHDFAITKNYAIFLDTPLVFNPKEMVTKGGMPFVWTPSLPARFGILPRYSLDDSEIRWFERPALFIFHTGNAWEEGDEVVLFACRMDRIDLNFTPKVTEKSSGKSRPMVNGVPAAGTEKENEEEEEGMSLPIVPYFYEFRFNLATGESSEKQLSKLSCEFPRINEVYLGRKHRYAYSAHTGAPLALTGVIKFDLEGQPPLDDTSPCPSPGSTVAGYFAHGPGRSGSEPVFVPRNRAGGGAEEEDDGYLLNFVYDKATDKSEVVVIDAKTMAQEPVAVVSLPTRVPYGFHGIFVPEGDIR